MHAYVKPISLTILKVDGLKNQEQATEIRQYVSKMKGVTACSANPVSELVSITFDPDQTSGASLSQLVTNFTQKPVQNASFEGVESSGPQCPVPLSYIIAFERVKYAFCFR
jgi:cation transport ATPase